jgi:SAM-dependent methyltransferase
VKRVLIRLNHGLGDVVQLTIVLKHLHHHWPDCQIDVEVNPGKQNIFGSLANGYNRGGAGDGHDEVYNLDWRENRLGEGHCPSTKVTKSLKEQFHLPEIAELYHYDITIPQRCRRNAQAFYDKLPKLKGYVIIHYQGFTSTDRKNIPDSDISWICEHLINNDYVPIIFDWDRTSPIPDQKTIFRADCSVQRNAGTIAALIDMADLFVGIDSGPLHVCGGLDTPGIGVWTGHHPIRFFDLADNVHHMLPSDSRNLRIKGRERATDYFHSNYRYEYYDDLPYSVAAAISKQLKIKLPTDNPMGMAFLLTATAYNKQYYEEHKAAGLDYLQYGRWQKDYANWIAESLDLKNKKLLDIGCACGSITRGFFDSGVNAYGCDVNEHMIRIGREEWGCSDRLNVCDSLNLHLYNDKDFQAIHLHQVAEHLRPDYVPLILAELNRVSSPSAYLMLFLDTTELFERQGRHGVDEDPTHICVKPTNWWMKRLELAGWSDYTVDCKNRLHGHRNDYFNLYDWEFICCRKSRDLVRNLE